MLISGKMGAVQGFDLLLDKQKQCRRAESENRRGPEILPSCFRLPKGLKRMQGLNKPKRCCLLVRQHGMVKNSIRGQNVVSASFYLQGRDRTSTGNGV